MKWVLLCIVALATNACKVEDRQVENYGDITSGPGGITLSTIDEHRGGWQRNECLICHNVNLNVHREANAQINIVDLNNRIRNNQGSKYCLTCHGANGTDQ
jgi:hypothetical protein